MPEDVKTEQMDSSWAQHLDKAKWKFSMPQFSANVEEALRSEKNAEYVWDDAIDHMVGYKSGMMKNSSEYGEFGGNMIKKYPCFS